MRNHDRLLITPLILCTILLVPLSGSALAAAPLFRWEPETAKITIGSGQEVTGPMRFTFESTRRLSDIRIEAVPELQSFVRMTPDHFSVVEAGSPQTVRIDFRLPPYASEGMYEGTIHIRQGTRTLPASLKLNIAVWYGGILISPTTKRLSDETLSTLLSVSEDASTLLFANDSPELTALDVGDILVFSTSEALPSGALRKIVSTGRNGDSYVVETIQASLEDAFENAEIDLGKTLTWEDLNTDIALTGTVLKKSDDPAADFEIVLEDEVLFDADGSPATTYDQIRMSGSISLETGVNFSLHIEDRRVTEVELVNIATEKAGLTLSSGVDIPSFEYSYTVAKYVFSPITIWAGWVPVILTPILTFNVGVDGSVSVSLEAGASQEAELSVGAAYVNGDWTPIAELRNNFEPHLPQVSGSASVQAWGGPTFDLLFYGITGPEVDFVGYLKFDAVLFRCPSWWQLWGGLRVDLAWKLESLGSFPQDEVSLPELVHLEKLLAEAATCPCFELTLGHTGSGQTPLAIPPSSPGCPVGEYHAGQLVQLTARPATDWTVTAWNGTDDDASSSVHNTLTMRPSDREVTVVYEPSIPDAPCLLFHSDRMGSVDVWMASLDGTQIRLTDKPGSEWVGRVTPDGDKFAYLWDGDGDPELAGIWLKAFDGSSDLKLMDDLESYQLGGVLAWSPDGTRFLYSRYTSSYTETRIASLAGEDEGLFLAPKYPYTRAGVTDWRGGKIVYSVGISHSGTNRVFVANEDGTDPVEVSAGHHGDHARFNSNGTKISYFYGSDVTLVDPDGSGAETLYTGVHRTGFIPFLPGDDMVAFAGFTHDSWTNDLYTVTVNEPHVLTPVTATHNVYYVSDVVPHCHRHR